MSAPTETAESEETEDGLTALDWAVIVAATVALAVLAIWAYKSRQPPEPPAAT